MSLIFDIGMMYLIISYYLASTIYAANGILLNKMLAPILITLIWLISKVAKGDIIRTLKPSNNIYKLFYIYFVLTGLSLAMSTDILFSISRIIGLISLFIISFHIVPEFINNKEKHLRYLEIIHWTLLILIIIGIIISLGNFSQSFYDHVTRIRYKSILENPNTLGLYTMIGCMTAIVLMGFKKQKARYLISLIINYIILLSTNSRTSLFCTILFIILASILYLYDKNKRLRLFVNNFYKRVKNLKPSTKIMIPIIILIMLSIGLIFLYQWNDVSIEEINKVLSGRIDRWFESFYEIDNIKTIVFGTGGVNDYTDPHNYLISVILNWGAISAVVFLGIILYTAIFIKNIIVEFRHDNYISKFAKLSLAAYFTILVYSNFESILFNIGNLLPIYLWSNIGILIHTKCDR